MKRLLDSDWPRAVLLKSSTSAKIVMPVQIIQIKIGIVQKMFPTIPEDFKKISKMMESYFKHFVTNFRNFPKISEDFIKN